MEWTARERFLMWAQLAAHVLVGVPLDVAVRAYRHSRRRRKHAPH